MAERRDAVYIRFSSDKQERGTSRQVQLERCLAFVRGDPLVYEDLGVTGTTVDRPGLNRLLADAKAGKIKRVLCYMWDRFGRTAYAHAVRADLIALGVEVVSVTEGSDPIVAGVQLVLAEQESVKKSARIKEARRKRFLQGGLPGGPDPYGYRSQDGQYVIEPNEAAFVRQAFTWYLNENIGFMQISKRLNEAGSKPRRARLWFPRSINTMLTNPLYKGVRRYGRRAVQFASKQPEPESYITELDVPELALVARDTFDAVQAKIAARSRTNTLPYAKVRPFSRLLKCACCGVGFIRIRGSKGVRYRLVCGTRERAGKDKCPNTTRLYEDELLAAVQATIREALDDREKLIEQAVAEIQARLSDVPGLVGQLKQRIAKLDTELTALTDRLTDPALQDPSVLRRVGDRIRELSEEDQVLTRQLREAEQRSVDAERIRQAVVEGFTKLEARVEAVATPAQLNAMIQETFGLMTVTPGGRIVSASPADEGCSPDPARLSKLHLFAALQRHVGR
ncbi:MAG: recombinase family protein [Planctomycetota bacterium]